MTPTPPVTDLTTGLSVLNARADVIDSSFHDNGTAILSDGTGNDSPGNGSFVGAAQVRINRGNITFNTVGTQQNNAGVNGNNNARINIWVFSDSNSGSVNVAGNTTNYACTGVNCIAFPAMYNMTTSLQ